MRTLSIYRLSVLLLILVLACSVSGQGELTTFSKKAQRAYQQSEKSFLSLDYSRALLYAQRAVDYDNRFVEAYLLLGDLYTELGEPIQSAIFYRKATDLNPEFYPTARLLAGKIGLKEGLYPEAKADFLRFLDYEGISSEERSQAEGLLGRCEFAIQSMDQPVPFHPVNLGDRINSLYDEYINAITVDNRELYLTVGIRSGSEGIEWMREEDFYISYFRDEAWTDREPLGPPMNTSGNEGALFISPDGRYLFYSACNQPDGYGSCDLYLSFRRNDRWGDPENLGDVINSAFWETQPCLASDGRTLYFVSNRPGGKGGSDIWCSRFLPGGGWSPPDNLGDSVNTDGDEMAPYIHPDNQSLYFSSTGHTGMGGYDLFIARKDTTGSWATPRNLGYPINTSADEINLLVDAAGKTAYISSDMPGGQGGMDIYRFELYSRIRPFPVTYMKGVVSDAKTLSPLGAGFELIDLETGLTVIESFSDPVTGDFLLTLPTDRDYALNVSAGGYAFHSEHISLRGVYTIDHPFHVDIALLPIIPDQIVILRNIFFDTDQYVLKNQSRIELNKLILFLEDNPEVNIEIRGHTDQMGTREYNDQLSLFRARAVYQFLIDHGIDAGRLDYHGYGFTIPLASNETEEGRQMNRRTEFRILENR